MSVLGTGAKCCGEPECMIRCGLVEPAETETPVVEGDEGEDDEL